jgi:hypothetical protein
MLEDRDLASVDILGGPGTCFERFAGRTLLAEFVFHGLPEKEQHSPLGKAATDTENETLSAVANTPGFTLYDVVVKLAYAHRLTLWGGEPENGPYGAAVADMVASALSDLVLMRAAERARPRLPEAAELTADTPKPLPTVTMALEQLADLLRSMTALFREQQEELRRLHGEREEEPATA